MAKPSTSADRFSFASCPPVALVPPSVEPGRGPGEARALGLEKRRGCEGEGEVREDGCVVVEAEEWADAAAPAAAAAAEEKEEEEEEDDAADAERCKSLIDDLR